MKSSERGRQPQRTLRRGSVNVTSSTTTAWKDKRAGFKHELIATLVDQGFTYAKAGELVRAIFDAIANALRRKDEVIVDGFGRWWVEKLPPSKTTRKWKLGKIAVPKPRKVRFTLEDNALLDAWDSSWKPHRAWAEAELGTPKQRRIRLAESERNREKQDRDAL
jgi:nucleoid DNA-binding protein